MGSPLGAACYISLWRLPQV